MGDNVQIVEDVTPNTESLDLSPVLDILGEISQLFAHYLPYFSTYLFISNILKCVY